MVRSKEGKQLELLRTLNKRFPEIALDKDDIDGANRRRIVDLLIANKDVNMILGTLETLGLDHGVLNAGILENIHKVSNDVLYEIKGLYFRTKSKVRPEVFMPTFSGLLADGVDIDRLIEVMQKTLETECLTEERVAARAAEKENERKEEMESNEQPTIVIDLNDPIGKRSINDLMDEWTEELRAERDAGEELKEGVDEELNSFKDTINELKEETINKTQEVFNKLKEARNKKEEEKAKEENSSIWLKLAIGAAVGTVVGVGVWAYKKYFEE
jgi:hypothetical protein|nr:MAG TPA: protein of unknown function (DUF883) [Caudoviricetes sp.]